MRQLLFIYYLIGYTRSSSRRYKIIHGTVTCSMYPHTNHLTITHLTCVLILLLPKKNKRYLCMNKPVFIQSFRNIELLLAFFQLPGEFFSFFFFFQRRPLFVLFIRQDLLYLFVFFLNRFLHLFRIYPSSCLRSVS